MQTDVFTAVFSFEVAPLLLAVDMMPFLSFLVDLVVVVFISLTDGTDVFVELFVDSACAVPKSNAKYTKQTVLGLIMVLQDKRERKGFVF